jgi:cation:H+ antiporter
MFEQLPLPANAAIFLAAATIVWFAGTRLAHCADEIARRTGIGSAFIGILLLGGITSLPELAVATTATLSGKPELSINDVLGSAAINVVILALADATLRREALTSKPGSPVVLLQGVLGIMLLALVIAPSIVGDVLVLGMGAWSWAMVCGYCLAIYVLAGAKGLHSWVPAGAGPGDADAERPRGSTDVSRVRLATQTALAAVAILATGYVLAEAGAALAAQSGLGLSFFGSVFLGFSTSLPEISTVIAAVQLRRYEMAIADVFGTNLFNVTIIALVDALHDGGPVLVESGSFASFGALLAIVLTGLFLAGIIERRNRKILRMGIDSLLAIALYTAGVMVLYSLR